MSQRLSIGGIAVGVWIGRSPRFTHVLDRHDDLQVELLGNPRIDNLTSSLRPDKEASNPLKGPLRSRKTDPLKGLWGGVFRASPLLL